MPDMHTLTWVCSTVERDVHTTIFFKFQPLISLHHHVVRLFRLYTYKHLLARRVWSGRRLRREVFLAVDDVQVPLRALAVADAQQLGLCHAAPQHGRHPAEDR